eukprot:gene5992-biopygen9350
MDAAAAAGDAASPDGGGSGQAELSSSNARILSLPRCTWS